MMPGPFTDAVVTELAGTLQDLYIRGIVVLGAEDLQPSEFANQIREEAAALIPADYKITPEIAGDIIAVLGTGIARAVMVDLQREWNELGEE